MDKPGDAKYGMTEEQMIESYKKLAAKGAKNFGIHAFLASNTISDEYYPELAGILFQLAVRVQKATGVHIESGLSRSVRCIGWWLNRFTSFVC